MQVKNPIRSIARILFYKVPIDCQLIVTRNCNLSCGYCHEYDNISLPVPLEDLYRRIDALHRLKVVNITLMGGEPLMHPNAAEIVSYAGRRAQVGVITNGFLLSDTLIEKLNDAGLNNMQVSIDTLHPDSDRYIQKTFKSLRPKLERLKKKAKFDVHVTTVLCKETVDEFKELLEEIRALGLRLSVGPVHDDTGHIQIKGQPYIDLWDFYCKEAEPFYFIEYEYGRKLLQGEKPSWVCSAGGRYLYVDEFGKVQFCATQMGRLNKPIEEYTRDDILAQYRTPKGCEGGCAVTCAYRSSLIENDKLSLVKAMWKAYLRGSFSTNHH